MGLRGFWSFYLLHHERRLHFVSNIPSFHHSFLEITGKLITCPPLPRILALEPYAVRGVGRRECYKFSKLYNFRHVVLLFSQNDRDMTGAL